MDIALDAAGQLDEDASGQDAALARLALDDPAAFGELYQRYRRRIYWYLRTRTPRDEDADDLTQQVFLAALDRLRQYRPRKASFATWLFTIARNTAIDFHRRHRSSTGWEGLPTALHPVDNRDLAADVAHHEAIARVHRLVAALPPEKRELLALRYAGGLSLAEMASVIGKSPAATHMQLTRLLHFLKEHYHDPRDQS